MSQKSRDGVRDPYLALRFPEYRSYVFATFLFTVSILVQEVVLGYQLYSLTHNPLSLAMAGLAEAVPFIALTLYGGHIADVKNKRRIILWSVAAITVGSTILAFFAQASLNGTIPTPTLLVVVYGMIVLIGICRAFQRPAASSLRAFLVPVSVYENAATWNTSFFQAGAILGPAIGGFLYAWLGFAQSLMAVVGMLLGALILFSRVTEKKGESAAVREDVFQSIKQGIRFVWHTKPILFAISLDLFSVLFGGVVAILPIYAQDILMVGARGLGILRAAPSAGAVITLLALSRMSPMRHAWRNMLIAVFGFGISILAFAISPWFLVSIGALFLSGAFDSISVVIRQTLLQLRTPEEMMGRVMAVNGIFISSSNELGAFESGVAAKVMGTIPSAIFGGVMTLVIAGWVSLRTRDLLTVRLDTAEGKM